MDNNKLDQFTLGDVLVVPSRNELNASEKTLRLQPKVMEVLNYLARHYDRVIPKEELAEQVWPGRVVTHGSVQKSINLLRKSLVELLGDREVIAHYSKKGYQLQIEPMFLETQKHVTGQSSPSPLQTGISLRVRKRTVGLVFLLAIVVVGVSYGWLNRHTLILHKAHDTEFRTVHGYISDSGHERAVQPHPDRKHLAYIRDESQAGGMGTNSQLVIRDDRGRDWVFADTAGSWVDLGWSPSGQNFIAIEEIREDGEPATPDFYSEAPRLYDVHIFSLDVINNRVLEKHRLSQWQGRISSGTWWDEETIELVGRQGDAAVNRRYRYSLPAQRLTMVEPPEFIANPMLARVHRGDTVIASQQGGSVRIDLLAQDQTRFASHQFDARSVELSWVPDGSGVLVYAAEDRALSILYRNGEVVELGLPYMSGTDRHGYRYSADGRQLFASEERAQADIWRQGVDSRALNLTENTYLNCSATFSPSGDRFAYVSIRNGSSQVWLVEGGGERRISQQPLSGKVTDVRWTANGEHILYQSGGVIYLYDLAREEGVTLLTDAPQLHPISINLELNELLALRQSGGTRNLWQLDLDTGEETQLTFGAVGSAVEHKGDIYFNYVGQKGLWVHRQAGGDLELIARALDKNSKLLAADNGGLFYITGGHCRESDIFHLSFENHKSRIYLARDNAGVVTTDIHPEKGALYTHCTLPESDIVLLD